jgi:hypothetical protein
MQDKVRRTQKMKGNKIIATLVVLTMLLSTAVVFNQFIKEASAQPGVDDWGYATTDLGYGVSYSHVYVDSYNWTGTGPYILYYPTYTSTSEGYASEFNWTGAFWVGGYQAKVLGKSYHEEIYTGGQAFTFNRSGLWIFDSNTDHSTYDGYIWVNTTTVYTIENIPDFNYQSSGSITVTVDTGSDSGCMIAILDPDGTTIYNKWRAAGVSEAIGIDQDNFTIAGDYTVKAYRDFDAQNNIYYYVDEDGDAYSSSYGLGVSATDYLYATIGPWDPPEKNATELTFTVGTGKPHIVLSNTSFYWGYPAWIDINITDNDGKGLESPLPIILKYGAKYITNFGAYIYNDNVTYGEALGNYSIQIPRYPAGWSDLAGPANVNDSNVNGTWRVYFTYDPNDDDIYEWNNSATFSIRSTNPPVRLVIADDGDGNDDMEIDVPAYTGLNHADTVTILFNIIGTSISDAEGRAYYGDDLWEDYKNITISGDILYDADATYTGTDGGWSAIVTPTKPGGEITISIDWPGDDNGTASQTIEIVNGAFVTPAVDKFTIGENFNLTVTVTDMDGDAVKNAQVYLIYEDIGDEFNSTVGDNTVGNGLNGQYTFWISPEDDSYPVEAPEDITIAARWYEGHWGYAKILMDRKHDMMVSITPTTAYAGDPIEYDIMVSLVGGGHPGTDDLTVALFNETGENLWETWYKDGDYDITDELIILPGGTYHIAAMNLTSDSQGNNATFVVTNYIVTSSPSILAWIIDDDVNMTFQLMPAGNGTLTLMNISGASEASIVNESTEISIENGVGTLDGVSATTLGNVTFSYRPDGGEDQCADGLLRITTATATPNPATIFLGEGTVVMITVTHPATGTPLEDVRVGLDHGMLLNESILAKLPTDVFTDANGQAEFSITADASGEVTIYIENETDPDNAFVIVATARKPMTISLNPSVNEGKTFTVEAKSNGVLITDTPVTFTFDGQTWPTTTGVATLTAPSVSTSLTYPITATAEGYATATGAMIMVVNIPKLIIAVAGEVKAGQTFTVTVADDTGGPVIGATITFDGKTYTSGAGGVATITAPSTEGTYPVTATFPGYETLSDTVTVVKGGGIPGFELLTLIAAIGVAFLLLRRRRN